MSIVSEFFLSLGTDLQIALKRDCIYNIDMLL